METFEDILKLAGGMGRWQLKMFLLASFAGFPAALQDFLYIFIAATPDHWCRVPQCETLSYEEMKNLTIPYDIRRGRQEFSQCRSHGKDDLIWTDEESACPVDGVYHLGGKTVPCTDFDFDMDTFEETIVTEWELVCEMERWRSVAQGVYFVGGLFGCLVFGVISDNYGRKLTILLSSTVCAALGPIAAVAPTFPLLLMSRFLLSFGSSAIFGATNVLVVETVEPSWRGLVGNLFAIPYGLGYASTAIFAYNFRHWRRLQFVVTVPMFMFLIIVGFLPESPRWLMSQGRAEESERIIRDMAAANGKGGRLPANFSDILKKMATKEVRGKSRKDGQNLEVQPFLQQFLSLFRTAGMRRRTLALNFCWFAVAMVYNGGAFSGPNLSANLFLYTLVSGLLEIPSYLIVPPLIKYFGRRRTFSTSFFACATAMFLSLLFEPGSLPVIGLAWFGILNIGSAYSLIYVYAAEVLPTSLRSYGMGVAAVVGRAGCLGGLYVTGLLGSTWKMAPTMILATVSFTAGFVALLLPETNKQRLPANVEDVENSIYKRNVGKLS